MTPAELKNRVLRKLRILGSGQTASAERTAIVTDAYTSVYNRLKRKNLVTWALIGNIDDAVSDALITLVAYQACDDFHIPEQRILRLKVLADEAMTDLIDLMRPEYVSTHTRVPYF